MNRILVFIVIFFSFVNIVKGQYIDVPSTVCLSTTNELQLKAGGGTKFYWTGPAGFVSNEQNPVVKNLSTNKSGEYKVLIDDKFPFAAIVSIGNNSNSNLTFDIYNSSQGYAYFSYSNYNYSDPILITGPNNYKSSIYNNTVPFLTKNVKGIYNLTVTNQFGCLTNRTSELKLSDTVCFKNPAISGNVSNKSIYKINTLKNPGSGFIDFRHCNLVDLELVADTSIFKDFKVKWFENKVLLSTTSKIIKTKPQSTYQVEINDGQCTYLSSSIVDKPESYASYYLSNFHNNQVDTLEMCSNSNGNLNLYSLNYLPYTSSNFKVYHDGVLIYNLPNVGNSFNVSKPGKYTARVELDGCVAEIEPLVLKEVNSLKVNLTSTDLKVSDNIEVCRSLLPTGFILNTDGVGLGRYSFSLFLDGVNQNVTGLSNYRFNKSGNYEIRLIDSQNSRCEGSKKFKVNFGNTQELGVTQRYFSEECRVSEYLEVPELSKVNYSLSGMVWTNLDNNSRIYLNNTYAYPRMAGNYRAQYTSANPACTASSPIIKVGIKEVAQIEGEATRKVCKGSATILRIKNITSNNFDWYLNGQLAPSLGSSYEVRVNEPGEYYAIQRVNVNSNQKCNLSFPSNKIKIEQLESVDLKVTKTCVEGNLKSISIPAANYSSIQWYKNGALIADQTKNVLTTSEQATYGVRAKIGTCEAEEFNIGMKIEESISDIVCVGSKFEFSPLTAGATYSWIGPNNFSSTSKILSINNFQKKNSGDYSLKISDKDGCIANKNFKLIASDSPDFTIPKSLDICPEKPLISFLKARPLTDSTENVSYYRMTDPNGVNIGINYYDKKTPLTQNGIYTIKAYSNVSFYLDNQYKYKNCFTEKKVDIKVMDKCKTLTMPKIDQMIVCEGKDFELPFNVNGSITPGTKFTLKPYYSESYSGPKTETFSIETQKSPFVIPYDIIKKMQGEKNIQIVSTDPNIVTSNFNNAENPNQIWVGSLINVLTPTAELVKFEYCDSLLTNLKSNYYGLEIDTMALFKNNILQNKFVNKPYNINTEGDYQIAYTFKSIETKAIALNQCEYKTPKFNFKKSEVKSLTNLLSSNEYFQQCGNSQAFVNLKSPFWIKDNSNVLAAFPKQTTLTWFKDGQAMSNVPNQSSTITLREKGSYNAEVAFQGCTIKSEKFNWAPTKSGSNFRTFINNKIAIKDNVEDQTFSFCKGTKLYVNGISNTSSTISKLELYRNNAFLTSISNVRGNTFEIVQDGSYYVKLVDGDCSDISSSFNIKFQDAIKTGIAKNHRVCGLVPLSFENNASKNFMETSKFSSVLYKDEKPIKSVINVTNYIESENIIEQGTYYYKTTFSDMNGQSCVSTSDTIKVISTNNITSLSSPIDYFSCRKDLILYNNSSDFRPLSNESNFYYAGEINFNRVPSLNWFKNDQVFANAVGVESGINVKESGNYYYTGTTKEGCSFKSPIYKVKLGEIKPTFANFIYHSNCDTYGEIININIAGVDYYQTTDYQIFKN
ncbi:MAG: hypothetical protein ACRCVT_03540, partial [Leadbetterella sp.]